MRGLKINKQTGRDTPLSATPEPKTVYTEAERKAISEEKNKAEAAAQKALKQARDKQADDYLKNISSSKEPYNNAKAENKNPKSSLSDRLSK